ncbi:hypothetical protein SLS61_001365 [Didymella pomorum]
METILTPDQSPDPKALDALPFLEALRLYPSATHRQDRVAPDEDLVFMYPDGKTLVVSAGTTVGMTAPLVNRNPSMYDSAGEFKPERFLTNPVLLQRHFTFGKGARQCLGMNLAYQELQTFIAGVFRKYAIYDEGKETQGGPTLQLFETTSEDGCGLVAMG